MTDPQLLIAREHARRDALVGDDMAALAELMTADIVHVHTTGAVHDKAQLIHHAGTVLRFIEVERGPLAVRFPSETVAVMTGPMINTVRRRDQAEQVRVEAFVTQVWVRETDAWRCASFHATRATETPRK